MRDGSHIDNRSSSEQQIVAGLGGDVKTAPAANPKQDPDDEFFKGFGESKELTKGDSPKQAAATQSELAQN